MPGLIERLKEGLGWYLGGVKPVDWNPCQNEAHFNYLIQEILKSDKAKAVFDQNLSDYSAVEIILMCAKKSSTLIELCAVSIGVSKN